MFEDCYYLFFSDGDNTDLKEAKKKLNLIKSAPRPKIYVNQIDEALHLVSDGGKVFVEKGVYEVMAGCSPSASSSSSFFVFGKSISLIGASTRGCVLLYKRQHQPPSPAEVAVDSETQLETFLLCSSDSQVPTLIKRLTFRNQNPDYIKTKFLGVAGGKVQLEVVVNVD